MGDVADETQLWEELMLDRELSAQGLLREARPGDLLRMVLNALPDSFNALLGERAHPCDFICVFLGIAGMEVGEDPLGDPSTMEVVWLEGPRGITAIRCQRVLRGRILSRFKDALG